MDAMVLGRERAPQKTVGFGDQATSLGKGCSRERTKHVSGSTLLGKTLHMPQATEQADPPRSRLLKDLTKPYSHDCASYKVQVHGATGSL